VAYRHLPEVSVAGSVDDAMCAYTALLKLTDNIVVAGDSAGGYLAAKIVELSARRALPAPRGLIGFSPLLSLDPDSQSRSSSRSVPMHEVLLPEGRVAEMRSMWLSDDVGIEGFATPLHAYEFIECPVHLVAVDDEFLCADIEAFAARLAARGVPVDLHLWGGLIHAFPSFLDFIPEGRQAVDHAARFAKECAWPVAA
jgi:epsilon-lactone hydrolase